MADSQKVSIPFPSKGMWASGDPGTIPEGYARSVDNMVLRSGPQWVARPPLSQDNGTTFSGFLGYILWDDLTNQVPRLIAFNSNGGNTDIYIKGTSGDTYGGAVTGTTGTGTPSAFANYKGIIYYCTATGSPSVPSAIFSYNGSTVSANPLGGETLYSLTIAQFIDRLFLGYVRATIDNILGTTNGYDATSWSAVTTTAANITNGSSVTSRITPTATTGSQLYVKDVKTINASTSTTSLVFRSNLRAVSPTDDMPITLQIYYSQSWVAGTTYAVGHIRVPTAATGNGYRYRVSAITTGIAAGVEPTWPTTVGSTVVDGGVTWICDGPDQVADEQFVVPTVSDSPDFNTFVARTVIPAMPQSAKVGVRIKFGTTDRPTITLNPIDFSFKDGATDGVLTKKNYGQQLTVGNFIYPFFNQESSGTATIDLQDDIYWTETADPNTIRGVNTYRLRESPGRVRAMAVVGNRLIVWKQRGMWVFQGTSDPDSPIIRERYFDGIGCVGPRAWTVFEDTLYFMSEQEIYAFSPGGTPEPILGAALRQSFLANHLQNLGGYSITAALTMAVDHINRDLYVPGYTKWFTYNLDFKAWSQHDSGAPASLETPQHLIWNPNTSKIYGKTGAALSPFVITLLDAGTSSNDSYGSQTSGTQSIAHAPLSSQSGRADLILNEVGVWAASSESLTVAVADDFLSSKTNTVTPLGPGQVSGMNRRNAVAIRHTVTDPIITISHTGKFGAAAFSYSRAEAVVRPLRTERTRAVPTQVSNTL